jgi:hypothetical protein
MLSFQITFKHEGILHLAEACNLMKKENICAELKTIFVLTHSRNKEGVGVGTAFHVTKFAF